MLAAGIDIIQLGSFVNPEKVPQMADTDKLFAHFSQAGKKPAAVVLSGLVLNEKGLERGMACGVEMFCMGVSASDTHSRKNTGKSTEEAVGQIIAMAQAAMKAQEARPGLGPVGVRLRLRRPDPRGAGAVDRRQVPGRRHPQHQPGRHGRPRPPAAGRDPCTARS